MAENDTQTAPPPNPVAAGNQPATVQTPVAITNFAFVSHFWEGAGGAAVPLTPQVANPGFFTTTGVQEHRLAAPQKGLQDILDDLMAAHARNRTKAQIQDLRFALVDLSEGKLLTPQFAGHGTTTPGPVGSTAKMGIMLAAFQLHFDLNNFAKNNPSITAEADLYSAIRAEWAKTQTLSQTPVVKQLHPGGGGIPKMELRDALVKIDPRQGVVPQFTFPLALHPQVNAPKLENIFVSSPRSGGGLQFKFKGNLALTQAAQDFQSDHHEDLAVARTLTFAERLACVIDASDNAASQTCVEDLGYLYINSMLWQSDLFSPSRGGGLWVATSFHNKKLRWFQSPIPDTQPDAFSQCTPASLAAMMTLIAQDKCVSAAASAAMRGLLNKRKVGIKTRFGNQRLPIDSFTRSPFEDALSFEDPGVQQKPRFTLDEVFSKLGIGNRHGDLVIIKRTDRTKKLHYVAMGVDDVTEDKLQALIIVLDKAIQQNNGLTPLDKPAPAPTP